MPRGIFVLGLLSFIFGVLALIILPIIGFLSILLGVLLMIVGLVSEEAAPAPVPPKPIKPKVKEEKKAEVTKPEKELPPPGYIYCLYCGEKIPKNSRFCPNCGAALEE
ncbi:MAG: zinc ribbon domain-containing protein [Candidatus Freyarchaeota archaeon]|nr:zinc ribbon domain-containing protein [Candidatus Jordarchaeia archaeon]